MNNGVLYWNKRQLLHFWWNNFDPPTKSGGHLYYRIPYTLDYYGSYITQKMIDDIKKIVEKLFKRNPDFKCCDICIGSVDNKNFTSKEWITAIVVINDRKFYDRYTEEQKIILEML